MFLSSMYELGLGTRDRLGKIERRVLGRRDEDDGGIPSLTSCSLLTHFTK